MFKRGMKGVYQHCDEHHLHRYPAESDFRFNERAALGVDDGDRATKMLQGIVGKRLTYWRINEEAVRLSGGRRNSAVFSAFSWTSLQLKQNCGDKAPPVIHS